MVENAHLLEESLCLLKKGVSLRAGVVVGLPPEIVGHPQVVLPICPPLLVRVVLKEKKRTAPGASSSQADAARRPIFTTWYCIKIIVQMYPIQIPRICLPHMGAAVKRVLYNPLSTSIISPNSAKCIPLIFQVVLSGAQGVVSTLCPRCVP